MRWFFTEVINNNISIHFMLRVSTCQALGWVFLPHWQSLIVKKKIHIFKISEHIVYVYKCVYVYYWNRIFIYNTYLARCSLFHFFKNAGYMKRYIEFTNHPWIRLKIFKNSTVVALSHWNLTMIWTFYLCGVTYIFLNGNTEAWNR